MSRSFTIESVKKTIGSTNVNFTGGRYISEHPGSAAAKMFTKAYHHLGSKGPLSLKITLRETTAGSKKSLFHYKVSRQAKHIEVERSGILITYKFKTNVLSI